MSQTTQAQTPEDPNAPKFNMHRIFVKKSSFESKNTNDIFKMEWKPEANIELKINNQEIEGQKGFFEVSMGITLTMQSNKRLAYIAEITQAGIFEIANFDEKQKDQLINAYCPATLYPFLRESVAQAVNMGGFPQMLLTPINFDAMYAQQLAEREKANTATEASKNATEKNALLEEPVTIN